MSFVAPLLDSSGKKKVTIRPTGRIVVGGRRWGGENHGHFLNIINASFMEPKIITYAHSKLFLAVNVKY